MSEPSTEDARRVLAAFPAASPADALVSLGNHGGFSGARLWRVETPRGPLCLRAWPRPGPSAARLSLVHRLMTRGRDAGLDFVPSLHRAGRATWVVHAGRPWELTAWVPGRADFHQRPTEGRLRSACQALARLHRAWEAVCPDAGGCPAVRRRLDRAREWDSLVRSGWRPDFGATADPELRAWAERGWRLVARLLDEVTGLLSPWAEREAALHPCLCDVWHDHVLFEGDRVSGIVDYGAVKVDHPAVDLARLLGSLAGDDRRAWAAGLDAYGTVRPLEPWEEGLSRVLDRAGAVLGVATWLLWLYRDGKAFAEPAAVARHLGALVRRLEGWG